jgi:hypothetical protein
MPTAPPSEHEIDALLLPRQRRVQRVALPTWKQPSQLLRYAKLRVRKREDWFHVVDATLKLCCGEAATGNSLALQFGQKRGRTFKNCTDRAQLRLSAPSHKKFASGGQITRGPLFVATREPFDRPCWRDGRLNNVYARDLQSGRESLSFEGICNEHIFVTRRHRLLDRFVQEAIVSRTARLFVGKRILGLRAE